MLMDFVLSCFPSKVLAAQEAFDECDGEAPRFCPSLCPPPEQDGFCQVSALFQLIFLAAFTFLQVNFLRTEPCSFSWDWGPAFAPVGIWRNLTLEIFKAAVIRDVLIYSSPWASTVNTRTRPEGDSVTTAPDSDSLITQAFRRTDDEFNFRKWDANVSVWLDAGITDIYGGEQSGSVDTRAPRHTISGVLHVTLLNQSITAHAPVTLQRGEEIAVNVTFRGLDVSPWYPNGFGSQPLYDFEIQFCVQDECTATIKRIGFRMVELVQEPLPGGKSFHFRVNGIPIPVHGSNWVPADAFESRVNRSVLEPFFVMLQASNQNMIRNWGGGIYQRDAFYDLADAYGIMIWEDMMFACADYMVGAEFLRSIAKEVRDNIRRLQHHPSIAIWAGNNENEYRYKPGSVDAGYYGELYFGTVLSNISALDNTRPMVGK